MCDWTRETKMRIEVKMIVIANGCLTSNKWTSSWEHRESKIEWPCSFARSWTRRFNSNRFQISSPSLQVINIAIHWLLSVNKRVEAKEIIILGTDLLILLYKLCKNRLWIIKTEDFLKELVTESYLQNHNRQVLLWFLKAVASIYNAVAQQK